MPASARCANNVLSGIFWMLMTTFFFVSVTVIVRYLGTDIPAPQAAFLRYIIGLAMISPWLLPAIRRPPTGRRLGLYATRGIAHGFAVMLWFFAMARIPIAEVTAIGYTSPIFITLGAALFLGERMHFRRIAAVVIAFGGAFIILRPGFQELSLGQLAQLGAAPMFAASFLLAKRMTDDEDPNVIVGWLSLFCTLTLLPFALADWKTPTWEEMGFLALTAALATLGHVTMTRAFKAAPITITQPIGFLQLVWAAVLGILLFGEPLDPFVVVGGAIVVGAATFISHREAVVARKQTTPPAAATKG